MTDLSTGEAMTDLPPGDAMTDPPPGIAIVALPLDNVMADLPPEDGTTDLPPSNPMADLSPGNAMVNQPRGPSPSHPVSTNIGKDTLIDSTTDVLGIDPQISCEGLESSETPQEPMIQWDDGAGGHNVHEGTGAVADTGEGTLVDEKGSAEIHLDLGDEAKTKHIDCSETKTDFEGQSDSKSNEAQSENIRSSQSKDITRRLADYIRGVRGETGGQSSTAGSDPPESKRGGEVLSAEVSSSGPEDDDSAECSLPIKPSEIFSVGNSSASMREQKDKQSGSGSESGSESGSGSGSGSECLLPIKPNEVFSAENSPAPVREQKDEPSGSASGSGSGSASGSGSESESETEEEIVDLWQFTYIESESSEDDKVKTPSKRKKKEQDPDWSKEMEEETGPRSSERLSVKRNKEFRMPTREDVFNKIDAEPSPRKSISELKPRRLVNDLMRGTSRYNYDANISTGESESSIEDFIKTDSDVEVKSSSGSDFPPRPKPKMTPRRYQPRKRKNSSGKKRTVIRPRSSSSSSEDDDTTPRKRRRSSRDAENCQQEVLATVLDTNKGQDVSSNLHSPVTLTEGVANNSTCGSNVASAVTVLPTGCNASNVIGDKQGALERSECSTGPVKSSETTMESVIDPKGSDNVKVVSDTSKLGSGDLDLLPSSINLDLLAGSNDELWQGLDLGSDFSDQESAKDITDLSAGDKEGNKIDSQDNSKSQDSGRGSQDSVTSSVQLAESGSESTSQKEKKEVDLERSDRHKLLAEKRQKKDDLFAKLREARAKRKSN